MLLVKHSGVYTDTKKKKVYWISVGFFFVLPETRSVTSSPVPAPPTPQTSKTSKPFGYGYPALQPGYQNTASPTPVQQPSNPGHHPGFQHYPQVHIFILKVTWWSSEKSFSSVIFTASGPINVDYNAHVIALVLTSY